MVNGHQCTIVWHVDDLKISHCEESVVNDITRKLNAEFGQCDNMSVSEGRVHDYLSMKLDYTVPTTLKVSMINYIDTILDDCPDGMDGTAVTPAASHLFKVNNINPEYLSVKDAEAFYHSTMQLAYLAHHAHPDVRTAVTFLQTRVQHPDWDDLKKLLQVIKYLHWTRCLELTLRINPAKKLTWWVDASYAVHSDMKGHTGGTLSLGCGSMYSLSTKQKLVSQSLTEAELIGVYDALPQMIWTGNFLQAHW